MDFMDTEILRLFIVRVKTVNDFSIDLVFINRKDNIIDLGKSLKAFRSNFNKMLKTFMRIGHLLILIFFCFPLETFSMA